MNKCVGRAQNLIREEGRGTVVIPLPRRIMLQDHYTRQTGYESMLSPEATQQGLSMGAPDDHILELLKDGKVIARYSQTGVTIDNILKEVEAGEYRN